MNKRASRIRCLTKLSLYSPAKSRAQEFDSMLEAAELS
jgi:hypothetical protein